MPGNDSFPAKLLFVFSGRTVFERATFGDHVIRTPKTGGQIELPPDYSGKDMAVSVDVFSLEEGKDDHAENGKIVLETENSA